jgi:ribonuclease-3
LENAVAWVKDTLGYEFQDETLLKRALTHRSAAGPHNERMEFLAAVLTLFTPQYLNQKRPDTPEGRLSRLRSRLVKDSTLGAVGVSMGIGRHLRLGSGEKKAGGHRRESIVADAVEAVFAAVYLDSGLAAAREVIFAALGDRIADLPVGGELRDPKSRLQELLQARKIPLPAYELEKTYGKAHAQTFDVSCSVEALGVKTYGQGSSRRDAEQAAARAMLAAIDSSED